MLVQRHDRAVCEGEGRHGCEKAFHFAVHVVVGEPRAGLDGFRDGMPPPDDEVAFSVAVVEIADILCFAAERQVDHVLETGAVIWDAAGRNGIFETGVDAVDLSRIQEAGLFGVAVDRNEEEKIGFLNPLAPLRHRGCAGDAEGPEQLGGREPAADVLDKVGRQFPNGGGVADPVVYDDIAVDDVVEQFLKNDVLECLEVTGKAAVVRVVKR